MLNIRKKITINRLTEYFPPTFGYQSLEGNTLDYVEILVNLNGIPELEKNITDENEHMIVYVSFQSNTYKLESLSVAIRSNCEEDFLDPSIFTKSEKLLLKLTAIKILHKYRVALKFKKKGSRKTNY